MSWGLCHALVSRLPGLLTLKSFHFTLAWAWDYEDEWNNATWLRFVRAIRQNTSLTDVVGLRSNDHDKMFRSVRRTRLAWYGKRNTALRCVLDGSLHYSVAVHLWPRLIKSIRWCVYGPRYVVRMVMAQQQEQQQ